MKQSLLFLFFCFLAISAFGQENNKPKIFTEDIDRFWIAYDSVQTIKDTTKQLHFIQSLYLDKATAGLKDFAALRRHSAQKHLANIRNNPQFWASVRPHTLKIRQHTKDFETLMRRFRKLYPAFRQPAVYFTIGCLNSGGTTGPNKILIGAEIAAADSTVNALELSPWLQSVFKDQKDVVYLVAHELGHTQQKEGENDSNLLGNCIKEGACDFIAELLLRQDIVSPYMTYGKAHEATLWKAFEKEMQGQETKNWLYNGSEAPNGQADLGYFMGYVICKSYYQNATNKQQALKRIIELDHSPESVLSFLRESKYPDQWKS